ncbi:MAG: sensor histidine kinase [Tepidamorphaceae bacterium]
MREVSHRSKNLLAIIQSIASQTARKSVNLEVFLNKFRGRLFSLAESRISSPLRTGRVRLFSLAKGQFKRYVSEGGEPIRITGDNVQLSPNESLHIGLALHELVVNATSHGALSHGSPTIALTSRRVEEDGQPMIEIVWQEAFGKNTANNDLESFSEIERRFGSRVLESAVPAAIGGVAEYEILPGEVAYRLTFPEHGDAEE